jgi:hypothetical protein
LNWAEIPVQQGHAWGGATELGAPAWPRASRASESRASSSVHHYRPGNEPHCSPRKASPSIQRHPSTRGFQRQRALVGPLRQLQPPVIPFLSAAPNTVAPAPLRRAHCGSRRHCRRSGSTALAFAAGLPWQPPAAAAAPQQRVCAPQAAATSAASTAALPANAEAGLTTAAAGFQRPL